MKTRNPWLGVVAVKTLRPRQVSFQWSGRKAWLGLNKQSPDVSSSEKFCRHQKRHFSLHQAHQECTHLTYPYTLISCPLIPHLYTSLTHATHNTHPTTLTDMDSTYMLTYISRATTPCTHTHTHTHTHFTPYELDPLLPCYLSSWVCLFVFFFFALWLFFSC